MHIFRHFFEVKMHIFHEKRCRAVVPRQPHVAIRMMRLPQCDSPTNGMYHSTIIFRVSSPKVTKYIPCGNSNFSFPLISLVRMV